MLKETIGNVLMMLGRMSLTTSALSWAGHRRINKDVAAKMDTKYMHQRLEELTFMRIQGGRWRHYSKYVICMFVSRAGVTFRPYRAWLTFSSYMIQSL
jgi:hypothetical protein